MQARPWPDSIGSCIIDFTHCASINDVTPGTTILLRFPCVTHNFSGHDFYEYSDDGYHGEGEYFLFQKWIIVPDIITVLYFN